MKLMRITTSVVLLTFLTGAAVFGGVTTLTLEQSVDIALDQNSDICIARKEVKKAKAGVWESYTSLMPSVDGNASLQHAWDIQTNTIPNFIKVMLGSSFPGVEEMPDYVQLSFGLENTFVYGASLTQPLFLGGAGIAGVKIANAGKQAAEFRLESKTQNLIYQTANAFYGCLLAKELVSVQTEAFKQAEANLDNVLKKYNVGSASGFDKMRAEVEVANLRPEVITAKNNYQSALTGLRTILNLPKDQEIQIQGELKYTNDDMSSISLDELQEKALHQRPEISALDQQMIMTAKGVTIARSQFLPKLFFATDYSYLGMRNDYKFKQDELSKGFTSAVSMQIPLFHGFKSHKNLQKARLDMKIMKDTEVQIESGVAAEVEIAYNKFHEAEEKYQSAKESIAMATEALRLANLTYEEGASTQLDVLNSQLALTRARLYHATALYEYQMARYQLRKVTGTLESVL